MPKSTGWWLAVALALVLLGVTEFALRQAGVAPAIQDSTLLWSAARDRVYDAGDGLRPLVLLGASRTQFGIDAQRLRERLPRHRPVMLAINGHYPVATLIDLADDPRFTGDVAVDVDSLGLVQLAQPMQAPWVEAFHQRWSRAWAWHGQALTVWQRFAAVAHPDHGWLPMLIRAVEHHHWQPPYSAIDADRTGAIDFAKTDANAVRAHFEADMEATRDQMTMPPPAQWMAGLGAVIRAAARIEARGGHVVFIQTPVAGTLRMLDRDLLPRADYWDRFAAASPVPVIHADDVPTFASVPLLDQSHVDIHERAAWTDGFVDALRLGGIGERGSTSGSTATPD